MEERKVIARQDRVLHQTEERVPDDDDYPDKDENAGGFSWHTAQYGQSRAWQEQYGGGLVALHFGL